MDFEASVTHVSTCFPPNSAELPVFITNEMTEASSLEDPDPTDALVEVTGTTFRCFLPTTDPWDQRCYASIVYIENNLPLIIYSAIQQTNKDKKHVT